MSRQSELSSAIAAAPAAQELSDRRRWWVLPVVVAAQFIFVVDAFIVNVAIPSIRAELHASAWEIEAVVAAYHTAERRWSLPTGGSVISGAASQGATAALMVPQVLATIHTLFPAAGRAKAFAVFGVALGLGGAAGFGLGGWLVTLHVAGLGWTSVFFVNVPAGIIIVTAASRLMPRMPGRAGTRLDIAGAAVLFLALVGIAGRFTAVTTWAGLRGCTAPSRRGWHCWSCSRVSNARWSVAAACRWSIWRCCGTAVSCAAWARRSASSSATPRSTCCSPCSCRASWGFHRCRAASPC